MGFIGTLKEQPADAVGHLCVHSDGRNQFSAPYENLCDFIYISSERTFLMACRVRLNAHHCFASISHVRSILD
jgi:hypothetical protein